jgi:predicted metal-dependent enzyme (double-stranded beta helix superfamily)
MSTIRNRTVFLLAITVGSVVGMFKGTEAKQKWVFKIKSRFEEKRHLAEQKKFVRQGGVALDDIEIASFHNN